MKSMHCFFSGVACAALFLSGCGSAVDVGGETDAASSSSGSGDDSGTPPAPPPDPPATSTSTSSPPPTTAGVTTDEPDDGSSDGGSNFITPDTGADTGPVEPQNNGGQCDGDDGCISGFCYSIPQVGGVCSECLLDQDCDTGTCSLDAAMGFAVCTDGSAGNQCNTDEGCMGELVCSELIDTGGIFNANFCSECETSAECDKGDLCTPFYDLNNLGGYFICAPPGSVEDGQGCPVEASEGVDDACLNGHCGVANLFGFAELGVCGECSIDDDCEGDQTCEPAAAGMNGLSGAFCQ